MMGRMDILFSCTDDFPFSTYSRYVADEISAIRRKTFQHVGRSEGRPPACQRGVSEATRPRTSALFSVSPVMPFPPTCLKHRSQPTALKPGTHPLYLPLGYPIRQHAPPQPLVVLSHQIRQRPMLPVLTQVRVREQVGELVVRRVRGGGGKGHWAADE